MSLRSRLISRFVDKSYRCDTGLPKYHYHEIETRMFHSMFEVLVDYVESEVAWSAVVMESFNDDLTLKRKIELEIIFFLQKYGLSNFRDATLGVNRMLRDGSSNDFDIARCGQEFADHPNSNEQLVELYKWYKDVYLARPDSYVIDEAETQYYLKYRELPPKVTLGSDERNTKLSNYLDIVSSISDAIEKEEDEKLQQLISLRRTMWT